MSNNIEIERVRAALQNSDSYKLKKIVSDLKSTLNTPTPASSALALLTTLDEACQDHNRIMRENAVRCLGEIFEKTRSPRPLRSLYLTLGDQYPSVKIQAVIALGKVGHRDAIGKLGDSLLYDPDQSVRQGSAIVLGEFRDGGATSSLIKACKNDPVRDVNAAAIVALGKIAFNDTDAILALIDVLSSRFPSTNEAFMHHSAARVLNHIIKSKDNHHFKDALARIGFMDVNWIDKMCNILSHDSDKDVRLAAASILGCFKDDKAIQCLGDAAHKDPEISVRKEAVLALGQIGKAGAIPDLLNVLSNDSDSSVCRAVGEALGKIKGASTALRQFKDTTTISRLNRNLLHPKTNIDVKAITASVLGCIKDISAVPTLLQALNDNIDKSLCKVVGRALGRIGGSQSESGLINTYFNTSKNPAVRNGSLVGLGLIGSEKAVDVLAQALNDIVLEVRCNAWSILKKLKTQEALVIRSQLTWNKKMLLRMECLGVLS
jgi:HEAT repeat protein